LRICPAVSTLDLAAASSMASGMPSSFWHSRATVAAFSFVSSKPASTDRARSTKRLMAS
jgi:hypothetical protein